MLCSPETLAGSWISSRVALYKNQHSDRQCVSPKWWLILRRHSVCPVRILLLVWMIYKSKMSRLAHLWPTVIFFTYFCSISISLPLNASIPSNAVRNALRYTACRYSQGQCWASIFLFWKQKEVMWCVASLCLQHLNSAGLLCHVSSGKNNSKAKCIALVPLWLCLMPDGKTMFSGECAVSTLAISVSKQAVYRDVCNQV